MLKKYTSKLKLLPEARPNEKDSFMFWDNWKNMVGRRRRNINFFFLPRVDGSGFCLRGHFLNVNSVKLVAKQLLNGMKYSWGLIWGLIILIECCITVGVFIQFRVWLLRNWVKLNWLSHRWNTAEVAEEVGTSVNVCSI